MPEAAHCAHSWPGSARGVFGRGAIHLPRRPPQSGSACHPPFHRARLTHRPELRFGKRRASGFRSRRFIANSIRTLRQFLSWCGLSNSVQGRRSLGSRRLDLSGFGHSDSGIALDEISIGHNDTQYDPGVRETTAELTDEVLVVSRGDCRRASNFHRETTMQELFLLRGENSTEDE
jgi:hypothetical protein